MIQKGKLMKQMWFCLNSKADRPVVLRPDLKLDIPNNYSILFCILFWKSYSTFPSRKNNELSERYLVCGVCPLKELATMSCIARLRVRREPN